MSPTIVMFFKYKSTSKVLQTFLISSTILTILIVIYFIGKCVISKQSDASTTFFIDIAVDKDTPYYDHDGDTQPDVGEKRDVPEHVQNFMRNSCGTGMQVWNDPLCAEDQIYFIWAYYMYKKLNGSRDGRYVNIKTTDVATQYLQIPLPYAHLTSEIAFPLISGDTFRAFSDYVYESSRWLDQSVDFYRPISLLKNGDVLFVDGDDFDTFIDNEFQRLQNSGVHFFLITHNTKVVSFPAKPSHFTVLKCDCLIHWFTVNFVLPTDMMFDKWRTFISAIPVGVRNEDEFKISEEEWKAEYEGCSYANFECFFMRNSRLASVYNSQKWVESVNIKYVRDNRDTLLSVDVSALSRERKGVPSMFDRKALRKIMNINESVDESLIRSSNFSHFKSVQDVRDYVNMLKTSMFTVFPEDTASATLLDSFTTWEAVLFQSIPIVKNSTLFSLYEKSPVLVVPDYKTVFNHLTSLKTVHVQHGQPVRNVIMASYWFDLINDKRKQII